MANRRKLDDPVTEVFRQIRLEHNKQIYQQHCNMSANLNKNSNTQSEQKDKEVQSSKRTRRRRRQKKRGDETQEDSISTRSISSNSNTSLSSFISGLVFENKNKVKQNEYSSASTSCTKNIGSLKDVLHFSIKPVTDNINSIFLRKRNLTQKFINLKSFFKGIPCLFLSKCEQSTNNKNNNKPKGKRHSKEESGRRRKRKENENFEDYINEDQVKEGLLNNTLIKGFIRINPKNSRESYVNNEDTSIADYFILSITDRNRALEGDEVILRLNPEEEWTEENRTAKVVYLLQKVHTRKCVGTLRLSDEKDSTFAMFIPRDKRFPALRIQELYWPDRFREYNNEFENILFLAQLLEWNTPDIAQGILIEKLGETGNLIVESISILKENNLDVTPFSDELKACIPKIDYIQEKEFEYREDIRNKCIFTIDPATARDLDDAVSVETLPNGNYEVGVHISDASFYLEEGTELDQVVSRKATSIYLVNNVYHMLPEELCMGCSLLPGEDKLTFSVFWEMDKNGDIVNKRFARSVINSCAKLAYEHAQMIIEHSGKEFSITDFPKIHNGFTVDDIVDKVVVLQNLAVALRKKRLRNGVLKISNIKLRFHLDPDTGEPIEFSIEENKEAHRLIEEFMLLANITVAQKIYDHFPELAFLRCHDPPKDKMLTDLQNKLSEYGIHFDTSSSATVAASLEKYITDDFEGQCRDIVLKHLTLKSMTRAQYFCAGKKTTKDDFKHYALSIPIYTHFTSPIRRYADIMVHRLLAASLSYREQPEWDKDYVQAIANNCNVQKYQAKKAGDASGELYLAHYVEKHQPFSETCVVVDVRETTFDVIVIKTGSIVRIYQNTCPRGTIWSYNSHKLTINVPRCKNFDTACIIVELFSVVTVKLKRKDSYHLEGRLVIQRQPIKGEKRRLKHPKESFRV
ncbi:DIS3-like exonuclease 2 [Diorhabda sublineata]|uniref:DIS3-like exonuclease 2 n=1 Tax=Diorhabda sublineata TaxID=1163346 RepID=UPI0024E181B3|nr:DIS3-like exonuclease 2 [Diorhabda sublineata]